MVIPAQAVVSPWNDRLRGSDALRQCEQAYGNIYLKN